MYYLRLNCCHNTQPAAPSKHIAVFSSKRKSSCLEPHWDASQSMPVYRINSQESPSQHLQRTLHIYYISGVKRLQRDTPTPATSAFPKWHLKYCFLLAMFMSWRGQSHSPGFEITSFSTHYIQNNFKICFWSSGIDLSSQTTFTTSWHQTLLVPCHRAYQPSPLEIAVQARVLHLNCT